MKKTKSNILLVVNGYNRNGVGERYIEAMIASTKNVNFSRYSLVSTDIQESIKPNYFFKTKKINRFSFPGLIELQFLLGHKRKLLLARDEILQIVEEKAIDLVWIFLNSIEAISLGALLRKETRTSMVSHIWDSPEYLAKKSFLSPIGRKKLQREFDRVMSKSVACVNVSSGMTKIYATKYDIECHTMVLCPPKEQWIKRSPKKNDKIINIVFAGSLYAYKEWNAFINAIEIFNIEQSEYKIHLTCIGNKSRWAKNKSWINDMDLLPQEEAAKYVNQADIAYLPYWMDSQYSHFVQTAFPGKLSFYTTSGTPILFHGPEVSTPADFMKKYKIGITCNSYNYQDIIKSILQLIENNFLENYDTERERALTEVFSPDRCKDILRKVIAKAT